MKDINHTMQLGAATMLAMLLGSYLYSSSAKVIELRYLSTVNTDIYLLEHSKIEGAQTVNGAIQTELNVSVNRSLSTINGVIQTSHGTVVGEQLSTVNGNIRLNGTYIGKNLQTRNGDIFLGDGSVVAGDIIINASSWIDRFFTFQQEAPNLIIDADSSVMGDIHLYRTINLIIADGAKLGDIIKHY